MFSGNDKFCPICMEKNKQRKIVLKFYKLDEGLYMCQDDECWYCPTTADGKLCTVKLTDQFLTFDIPMENFATGNNEDLLSQRERSDFVLLPEYKEYVTKDIERELEEKEVINKLNKLLLSKLDLKNLVNN